MAVFFAGNIEELFVKKVELKANFRDVGGLRKGAPVWLFGTEIGAVRGIDLNPTYGTVVTMSINRSALPYIRKDSNASVLTMGLLGDKYVEISAGSPNGGAHPATRDDPRSFADRVAGRDENRRCDHPNHDRVHQKT